MIIPTASYYVIKNNQVTFYDEYSDVISEYDLDILSGKQSGDNTYEYCKNKLDDEYTNKRKPYKIVLYYRFKMPSHRGIAFYDKHGYQLKIGNFSSEEFNIDAIISYVDNENYFKLDISWIKNNKDKIILVDDYTSFANKKPNECPSCIIL